MTFNKPYWVVLYICAALLCLQTPSIIAYPILIVATDATAAEPASTAATEPASTDKTVVQVSTLVGESTDQPKDIESTEQPKDTAYTTMAPVAEDGSSEPAVVQSDKVSTTATSTPTTAAPETTVATTTSVPPVICEDLEMADSHSYSDVLGSIPKPPSADNRILPINGIKLPRRSCKELYADGYTKSGLYIIKPCKAEVTVFCDMTFLGGGWTVIQRRLSKSDIFYKNYQDYQQGFGDLSSNMWLGLDTIHCLTSPKSTELFVGLDATDFFYSALVYYGNFSVGDESSNYVLTVKNYASNLHSLPFTVPQFTSNGLDSLTTHSGEQFSAKDRDNDADTTTHCGQIHKGGWWYKNCYKSNLNGDKMVWNSFIYEADMTNSVMAVR